MVNLTRATEAATAAFPDRDPERLRDVIKRLVEEVRESPVERGDFTYQATYGIHVQKVWYEDEDTPDVVEVFLSVASDYDEGV